MCSTRTIGSGPNDSGEEITRPWISTPPSHVQAMRSMVTGTPIWRDISPAKYFRMASTGSHKGIVA